MKLNEALNLFQLHSNPSKLEKYGQMQNRANEKHPCLIVLNVKNGVGEGAVLRRRSLNELLKEYTEVLWVLPRTSEQILKHEQDVLPMTKQHREEYYRTRPDYTSKENYELVKQNYDRKVAIAEKTIDMAQKYQLSSQISLRSDKGTNDYVYTSIPYDIVASLVTQKLRHDGQDIEHLLANPDGNEEWNE